MIGQVLGHYQLQEKLGSGGMGEVYRARDQRLQRDVAVKVIASIHGTHKQIQHRLLDEARAASALRACNKTPTGTRHG